MQYKSRTGQLLGQVSKEDRFIRFLYSSHIGGTVLSILTCPKISKAAGKFLDTPVSTLLIDPFIKQNQLTLTDCVPKRYDSFNDFFTRRLRNGCRPVDVTPSHLISPCDGKLTVIPITEGQTFEIKHITYDLTTLLRDRSLADEYTGGTALLFRLSVNDYHRYCYIDDANKDVNHFLPGVLHTVNPNAAESLPIYAENSRCYCQMQTENFGPVLQMEIGALLVGKIRNLHNRREVSRGQEKGYFEYGGSSILLLFREDTILIDADILQNTADGYETEVHLGERIGQAK